MPKTIKTGTLYRTLELSREEVDREARTVPLAFSSEISVDRWFGKEILDHSSKSVRLKRLKDGGAVLVDHNRADHIGVVESVSIGADRKGRAVVRFGRSARAEEIFNDVLDGIRRHVSVGYQIHQMMLEEEKDGTSTYRATDWEPMEISIVSVPADPTVGIGRAEGQEFEIKIMATPKEAREMEKCTSCGSEIHEGRCSNANCSTRSAAQSSSPAVTVSVMNVDSVRNQAAAAERTRVSEILALGEKYKAGDMAREHINSGRSVDDFKGAILEKMGRAEPIATPNPNIGMSQQDLGRYSIVNAIRQIANNGRLDGIEREASEAVAKLCKREARGFFIPNDVVVGQRDMGVGDSTKGGYTVGTQVLTGSMIEILRNRPLVAQLGARTLSGLVGNIMIPRITGGATAYWLSETGTVTKSDQAFGQLGLTPHRLVGDTAFSKELLMQSSLDVEAFVREDLMNVLSIEKDRAAINGLGANGEPVGILNTTGIKTVTFGAAATWAKAIDFETQIEAANANPGTRAYLSSPTVKGKWKGTVKVANTAQFLWEGNSVNGYRAEATNQVPSNKVIFGNFDDLIIAEWAGIDVVVDPYSLKKQGQIEITTTLWCDIAVRHAVSFCASTDSGAQ